MEKPHQVTAETQRKQLDEYMKTLTEKERTAYEIARAHLQSSFQLEKSNGFIQWKKHQL